MHPGHPRPLDECPNPTPRIPKVLYTKELQLQSKLIKGGCMGNHIRDYARVIQGDTIGVKTVAHI